VTQLLTSTLVFAFAFWLAWQLSKLLVWTLRGVFGTTTGWLLIALALGALGLFLLRSDGDYGTLLALACIASAVVIVCVVEHLENVRERERQARLRAAYVRESRRREQANAAVAPRELQFDRVRATVGGEHPLNAEYIDGIWVVAASAKSAPDASSYVRSSSAERSKDASAHSSSSGNSFHPDRAREQTDARFAAVEREINALRRAGPARIAPPH